MLMVIIIFALFATVFPIGKMSMVYVQPIFLTSMRMIWAGILLIGYHRIKYPQGIQWNRRVIINLVSLAVLNIYITNVFEFWGLQYLSAGKACFIYNLAPFASALVSYFFFHEIMTVKKWLGLIIGFMGFIPVLLHSTPAELTIGGIGFLSWGEIALMCAALGTVFGWIIMRQTVKSGIPVIYANGWSMLIGGVAALFTSYAIENWDPLPFSDYTHFVSYTLVLMCISNIFCYNMYAHLLKTYTATFLTFFGFTCPLWAALYGWLFLREPITSSFLISCVLVSLGLYIFYSEEIRLGYVRHH